MAPLVSVVICTRNRGDYILRAVNSILASDYLYYELLIVDQSDDRATWRRLAPLLEGSSSIRYFALAVPGKANALNHAWRWARGEYLAITDDDCTMTPNCLSKLVAAFQANSALGLIFGDVAAAHHDERHRYIPAARMRDAKTIHHSHDFLTIPVHRPGSWMNWGIGANMAVRTAALADIQGWDPCICAGEKFGSGDDHDLAFRLLHAGYEVHFCPAARVVHYGFRGLMHIRQYHWLVGRGFGASCIKYLRCGLLYHASIRTIASHLLRLAMHWARLRRSESGPFVLGWLSGFAAGLAQPLNKKALCFEKKATAGHTFYA